MAEFHTHVDETKEAEDTNAKGVVVDFFATWCGYVSITWHGAHVIYQHKKLMKKDHRPCKMIAPRVDGFSTQFPNITFLKVDVDESAVSRPVEIPGEPADPSKRISQRNTRSPRCQPSSCLKAVRL